jgi:hypothetical protein
MPLSDAALAKAEKDLEKVELESFKATPPTISPFGQSELRWRATAPSSVQFQLDGRPVPRIGSQVVRPSDTRTFKLTAHSGPLSDFVGQVTVSVDLGACTTIFLSEDLVRETLDAVVEEFLIDHPQVQKRAAPFVDVTPNGIVLKLRFEIEVKCSRNPDFNVDALIGLRIEGTEIVPSFKSFEGNLDYSALEDALNFTIGAFLGFGPQLAIAIAEDNAQSAARRAILDGLSGEIEDVLRAAPLGSAPSRLVLRDDGIEIRLCPLPGFKRPIRIPTSGLTSVTIRTAGTGRGGASKEPGSTRAKRASTRSAGGGRRKKTTETRSNRRRGSS